MENNTPQVQPLKHSRAGAMSLIIAFLVIILFGVMVIGPEMLNFIWNLLPDSFASVPLFYGGLSLVGLIIGFYGLSADRKKHLTRLNKVAIVGTVLCTIFFLTFAFWAHLTYQWAAQELEKRFDYRDRGG